MPSYALQTDLEQRFGIDAVLTASDRNGKGEINVTIVTLALVDATAEIDSYLAAKYDLPLTTVPTILARICSDIAMYRMSADIGALTEEKRTRFDDAIKWLRDVAKGTASLGLATLSPSLVQVVGLLALPAAIGWTVGLFVERLLSRDEAAVPYSASLVRRGLWTLYSAAALAAGALELFR